MRTGLENRTDVGLLQAFRQERLAYVLLLCACLVLQGAVPSFAAALFGQGHDALNFVLCNGSTPVEDSNDTVGGGHPCLSGQCAMAGSDPGVPPAAQVWKIDQTRQSQFVGADERIVLARNAMRVAIRGPPHNP